jgi:hypothetical protein
MHSMRTGDGHFSETVSGQEGLLESRLGLGQVRHGGGLGEP